MAAQASSVEKTTIIHARWVVPVVPLMQILHRHTVVMKGSVITDLLPTEEARVKYGDGEPGAAVKEFGETHLVIPGLINMHTHMAMSLFRGLADDLKLMEWLEGHIWKAEGEFVTEEFVEDGTRLALAELVRGGVTCVNDMYFFPHTSAAVLEEVGVRGAIGAPVIMFPTRYAKDREEYVEKGEKLFDQFKGSSLVQTTWALHAPYTVSDDDLCRVKEVNAARSPASPRINMHVHETCGEVDRKVDADGKRPMQWLKEAGVLGPKFIAVHMVACNDEDTATLVETGASVVHCPESNAKLASGMAPAQKLLEAGVNVCLGTDGAASNNDLDMLGEMRTAAFVAKLRGDDPTHMGVQQLLEMATINGARALGLEDRVGSLEVGKQADVVAVDLSGVATQPVFNPVSTLVYAASRNDVTDVWVGGRPLLDAGKLVTMDEAKIRLATLVWQRRLAALQGARLLSVAALRATSESAAQRASMVAAMDVGVDK